VIEDRSLGTIGAMISGALNEVALASAHSSDPGQRVDDAIDLLRPMLEGLAPSRAT
jgi:hypothetical protein